MKKRLTSLLSITSLLTALSILLIVPATAQEKTGPLNPSEILDLMEQTMIPAHLNFRDASFHQAVRYLNAAAKELDPRPANKRAAGHIQILIDDDLFQEKIQADQADPKDNFNFHGGVAFPEKERRIYPKLRNINLRDALEILTDVTNTQYTIRNGKVIIHALDKVIAPLLKHMEQTILPELHLKNANIYDIVEDLLPATNSTAIPLPFEFRKQNGVDKPKPVTFTAKNITAKDALDTTITMAGMTYRVINHEEDKRKKEQKEKNREEVLTLTATRGGAPLPVDIVVDLPDHPRPKQAQGENGGVGFFDDPADGSPTITLNVKRINLRDAIEFITGISDLHYVIEGKTIRILEMRQVHDPVTRIYPVGTNFFQRVGERSGGHLVPLFADSPAQAFGILGIYFPPGNSSATYDPERNRFIIHNSTGNHDAVAEVLKILMRSPDEIKPIEPPPPLEDFAWITERMEAVNIPELKFKNASIYDVGDFLSAAWEDANDPQPPQPPQSPQQNERQVSIIIDLLDPDLFFDPVDFFDPRDFDPNLEEADEDPFPRVTLDHKNINLRQAIEEVAKTTDLTYTVTEKAVIIHEKRSAIEVMTRFYPFAHETANRLLSSQTPDMPEPKTDFEKEIAVYFQTTADAKVIYDPKAGFATPGGGIFGTELAHVFEDLHGVPFPPGTTAVYQRGLRQLVVVNSRQNHIKLEAVLKKLAQ